MRDSDNKVMSHHMSYIGLYPPEGVKCAIKAPVMKPNKIFYGIDARGKDIGGTLWLRINRIYRRFDSVASIMYL